MKKMRYILAATVVAFGICGTGAAMEKDQEEDPYANVPPGQLLEVGRKRANLLTGRLHTVIKDLKKSKYYLQQKVAVLQNQINENNVNTAALNNRLKQKAIDSQGHYRSTNKTENIEQTVDRLITEIGLLTQENLALSELVSKLSQALKEFVGNKITSKFD